MKDTDLRVDVKWRIGGRRQGAGTPKMTMDGCVEGRGWRRKIDQALKKFDLRTKTVLTSDMEEEAGTKEENVVGAVEEVRHCV